MFLRLLLSIIFLCGTGISFAQMDEAIKTRQETMRNQGSTPISDKVKNTFVNAEVEETIAKWSIDDYHILMLFNRGSENGIIYILPHEQKKDADPAELLKVANNIDRALKNDGQKSNISIDEKGTYGQIILGTPTKPSKKLLSIDSYSDTKNDKALPSTNVEYLSIYKALIYLNGHLGQPFAWLDNRPVWRHIYNHDKSGILISLDLFAEQANCFDMKRIGTKIDDKLIVPELNKIFNTTIKTPRSFIDVKPWRDNSGFASNKIIGADEISAVYPTLISDPNDGWNSRKKIKRIDVFCLVKTGNFLRFGSYERLNNSPKDEEDWMRSHQIRFPKKVDTLADFVEVQAPTPQEETEAETEEIAQENKNEQDIPEETKAPSDEPLKSPEKKREPSPEEALELYIKSLQEFKPKPKGTLTKAH